MEYQVNNKTLTYSVEGKKSWGEDVVLANGALDLTTGMPWHETGYSVIKLFDDDELKKLHDKTAKRLLQLLREAGVSIPENFSFENYHTLVPDFETHLRVIEKTKLLNAESFPIDISVVSSRVSALLKTEVQAYNPFDHQRVFHFRIIRPMSGDNNPLHRDVWLEDYDDCINLYIPIVGSNENSSLILAPGSHLWPESKIEKTVSGAVIDGKKFNVPAVTNIRGEVEFIRPNPTNEEVIIFSPYLIHGGAINFNEDTTRISIELRLWRR